MRRWWARLTGEAKARFFVHRRNGDFVLGVLGEVDVSNVSMFQRHLDTVAVAVPAKLIVDLRDLRFIDVRGAGTLVDTAKTLDAFGTRVVLRSPNAVVRRVLDVIGCAPATIEP